MEQVFVGPHSRTKIYAARTVRGISRSIDMCCRPALLWAHDGTKQQFSKPTGPRRLLSIDGTDGQTDRRQTLNHFMTFPAERVINIGIERNMLTATVIT